MKKVFLESSLDPGLFWDGLLNAHLYVPLADHARGFKKTHKEIESFDSVPVLLGVDSKGENILWIFTSPEVMVDYTEKNLTYIEVPAQKMMSLVKDASHEVILIGPERITLNLDPRLMNSLSLGKVPEPPKEEIKYIPKESGLQVRSPIIETGPLEEKFKILFENVPEVLEATFVQIADASGERLLLGIKLENESKESFRLVAQLIARAAEGVLEKGKTIDITLIRGSLEKAFEKYGEAFYEK